MLTSAERKQIVVDWNDTAVDQPPTMGVHRLVEAQSERTPHAEALVFEGQSLTYDELNRRANRLAHRLRALHVGREAMVGICVERSIESIVAILGVLKAGGAYVPLDPSYPSERLQFMLEDTAAPILLTQRRIAPSLPPYRGELVWLDDFVRRFDSWPDHTPDVEVRPEDLAYVMYTSGSTGTPKGVLIEHGGVTNTILVGLPVWDIGPGTRFLQFSSLGFDTSVSEIFTTLSSGATLVIASQEALAPGPALTKTFQDERIDTVMMPPSILRVLSPKEVSELKTIISGGEACPTEMVRQWAQGRRFYDSYGPTEASIRVTIAERSPDEAAPTIGKPSADCTLYVLDSQLQPVPVGIPGELHIGGVAVGRGYLNRPELTRERFIPDPFSTTPGSRLYKTGDLTRYLPDGSIEFLGRVDQQIKIRGVRIELGEIEATLIQHPSVREAVVVVAEAPAGDRRLVAYIVPSEVAPLDVADVRSFVQATLPTYMAPSTIVILESLPLNANGKIDRTALPAPETAERRAGTQTIGPRTQVEALLVGIWSEVLGVEAIGVHDNFFELGGDSLRVVQVLARVRAATQIEISIRRFFEDPTVQGLGQAVEAGSNRGGTSGAIPRRARRE